MLKKMMIQGGVVIAGVMVVDAIEKLNNKLKETNTECESEKEMLKVKNLFKKVKKLANVETRDWYTAEMESPNGMIYETGVRAENEEEARAAIIHDSNKQCKILSIRKGDF